MELKKYIESTAKVIIPSIDHLQLVEYKNKELDFLFGTVKKKRILSGFHPNKINWKFNIYPSHSCGFFVRKKIHKKIGFYNQKYKLSADKDFIYRLIKNGYNGKSSKKSEVFGNFYMYGQSSKLPFAESLIEDCKIRLDNKESIVRVTIIFVLHILNKIKNTFFPKIK